MIYVRGHKLVTVYTREWGSFKYITCDASSNKRAVEMFTQRSLGGKVLIHLTVWLKKKKKKEEGPKRVNRVLFHFYAYTGTFSNQVHSFRKRSREKYARRRVGIILGL